MLILAIDTSGHTASATLLRDGALLGQTQLYTQRTHSQVMLPLCKQLLETAETTLAEIDLFAVADGPGSYTGLRIGIAAIKAMAFSLDVPCVGISTLEGLAYQLLATQGIICAAIHARQTLYYCAIFSSDGSKLTRMTADAILEETVLSQQLASYGQPIVINGDGATAICQANPAFRPAPPHLLLQSATGIALAAAQQPSGTAETLCARYLQPTQAEKLRR